MMLSPMGCNPGRRMALLAKQAQRGMQWGRNTEYRIFQDRGVNSHDSPLLIDRLRGGPCANVNAAVRGSIDALIARPADQVCVRVREGNRTV